MRALAGVLALIVLVGACSDSSDRDPIDRAVRTPAATPSASSTPPARDPGSVPCDDAVGGSAEPDVDLTVIADGVAVPASGRMPRALQSAAVDLDTVGPSYFAKAGLLVRRGARVELRVARVMIGRAWIGWGSPATPATRVVVDRCASTEEWIAFAGGYWVRRPGCIPVSIKVNGVDEQEVSVGVGAPCPGQAPPVQPGS